MEKHTDACNEIIKEMCLRKSYKGEPRQFIVTSRTWKPFLKSFLNEKTIADSTLIIGNYLEAALWAGCSLQLILCNTKAKLNHLTGNIRIQKFIINQFEEEKSLTKKNNIQIVSFSDQINAIPIAKERVIVICNECEEVEQVAKHLKSNNIPVEIVKNIFTDCKCYLLISQCNIQKEITLNRLRFRA